MTRRASFQAFGRSFQAIGRWRLRFSPGPVCKSKFESTVRRFEILMSDETPRSAVPHRLESETIEVELGA